VIWLTARLDSVRVPSPRGQNRPGLSIEPGLRSTVSQIIQPHEQIEAQAFKRQHMAFCVLTLFVIAALLLLHTQFAALLGHPSIAVILLLAACFLAKVLEWNWLRHQRDGISLRTARIESAISVVFLFVLAWVLAFLTDRDDAPYFVLLAIAILQCAYHFGLIANLVTIAVAIGMMFTWARHFFALHPPSRPTEFLETGMISVIYALMGLLVWYLVNQLSQREARLLENAAELQAARESLAREEKLAAVGRLASGIAHEIRNPVAMIASSLATATDPGAGEPERDEMFAIAAREATRLESLTSDFLAYARPASPQRSPVRILEVMEHIASMTRLRAAEKCIQVVSSPCDDRLVEIDPFQVEGALLNLCLNAVEATPAKGRVVLKTRFQEDGVQFDIENSGEAISKSTLTRIFEPFFTTRQRGTGLGLAIARGIARAHGGELWVSRNDPDAIVFTMSLSSRENESRKELSDG
jgi:two-component system, NtrC family, sensor histidine kinase HydH